MRLQPSRTLGVARICIALLMLLGALVCTATPITYVVNRTVGVGSITGTIQTDGTIGTLSTGNITDWNLILNDGTHTFNLTGLLSGNNSAVVITGTDVTASITQLLFSFDANVSALLFQQGLFSGTHYYCANSAWSACFPNQESVVPQSIFDAGAIHVPQQGVQVIGTASTSRPVPEPATLLLISVGLVGLGFSRRKP